MAAGGGLPGTQVLAGNALRWLRAHFYRWGGPRFGLRDALLWFDAVDIWHRYTAIREALGEALRAGVRILEVGPGWYGLEFFLPEDFDDTGLLVQLDVVPRPVRAERRSVRRVLASGWALPFNDRTFDVVVAADVLEHLPKDRRRTFAEELKRVTRGSVLLHVPLENEDGTFQAASCDRSLQRWLRAVRGREDSFLEEHLRHGHPTPAEIQDYFPGALLTPTQSVREWSWYMKQERVPVANLLTGLRSYLRGVSGRPPYYGGLHVWMRKEKGAIRRGISPPPGLVSETENDAARTSD
ncbi:MAG: methyltransferase domain-containing protein [Thermoplasmata archaeon]